MTNRLTVDRSTAELLRNVALTIYNVSVVFRRWQGLLQNFFQLAYCPDNSTQKPLKSDTRDFADASIDSTAHA